MDQALHVEVSGVVQGVGFRPFVYNLATRLGLRGWVLNHSGGVEIEVEGSQERLDAFVTALRAEAPPLAHIEALAARPIPPVGFSHFEIRRSERQEGRYQLISPDIATCPDCLREVLDPTDRRYRYPFTNCTNCGPRFTIIADIPYDRPNTTMRAFAMCPDCQREYDDPANRRFHAQPNACSICGPHLWLTDSAGQLLAGDASQALSQVRDRLLAGQIVAIRGLGGFQLACDATNADAVRTLRARKQRPHKPFAVMVTTLGELRQICDISPAEEALLNSPQAPIVLLDRRPGSAIAEEVAPSLHTLGVMLPYTPLHHLLMRDVGRPLVMTSGNLSEEPIAQDNDEALRRLGSLADAFLLHNREIYSRYDDSVWQVAARPGREDRAPTGSDGDDGIAQPVRRARGYAPFPIRLPFQVRPILAVGPDLKNTFCLARDEYAFVSQHIGDMENLETLEHLEATLAVYQHLFRLEPEVIACDLHPDYATTRLALDRAGQGLPLLRVQHHQAHIAACLVDNGWKPDDGPVIGVALDGTGYGEDGAIWGGEWLIGDYRGFRRAAHLEYLPLPGGDAAIRHPWRIATAYFYTLLGSDAVPPALFPSAVAKEGGAAALLYRQIERRINTPLTSSMGRLFDAVSALLGVCSEVATYEAQPAIELEAIAAEAGSHGGDGIDPYPFELQQAGDGLQIRLGPLLAALAGEQEGRQGQAGSVQGAAYRFHVTVARMIEATCIRLRDQVGVRTAALSGGCFQNRLLLELTVPLLEEAGFRVLLHRQVPCNDGGVSLGQAVMGSWAASS
jgi:hydrogenase maturation protein HypF